MFTCAQNLKLNLSLLEEMYCQLNEYVFLKYGYPSHCSHHEKNFEMKKGCQTPGRSIVSTG